MQNCSVLSACRQLVLSWRVQVLRLTSLMQARLVSACAAMWGAAWSSWSLQDVSRAPC